MSSHGNQPTDLHLAHTFCLLSSTLNSVSADIPPHCIDDVGPNVGRRAVLAGIAGAGISTFSLPSAVAAASAATTPATIPAPSTPTLTSAIPAGTRLSSGDAGNGAIEVTWGAAAGASTYVVRTRTPSGVGSYVTYPTTTTDTRLIIDGLSETSTYDVVVAAANADGSSPDSSAITGVGTVIATGGTVTSFLGDGTIGNTGIRYVVHSFSSAGNSTLTVSRDRNVDYLVVAGGGGGSRSGGGGAGGLRSGSTSVTAGNALTMTIGAGGAGSSDAGAGKDGGNSSAFGLTAVGGGGGGANSASGTGRPGGSGGGGGAVAMGYTNAGGAGTSGQGNNGGSSYGYIAFPGGGGGGAGGVGGNGTNDGATVRGGAGGIGLTSTITGESVGYAGGGAGASYNSSGSPGTAQTSFGGGAAAPNATSNGGNGVDGTGGGGGGAPASYTGGSGGSGIIIVRYPLPS